MKRIITIIFSFFCHFAYSQCINCNSLKEALKKPGIVKSLDINAHAHKIFFDSFPKAVFTLVNLEVLGLSDENLQSIPSEIGNLKNLKKISFPHCNLEKIPEEIFNLKKLQTINLMSNNFSLEYLKLLKSKFKTHLPNTLVFISKEYADIPSDCITCRPGN